MLSLDHVVRARRLGLVDAQFTVDEDLKHFGLLLTELNVVGQNTSEPADDQSIDQAVDEMCPIVCKLAPENI